MINLAIFYSLAILVIAIIELIGKPVNKINKVLWSLFCILGTCAVSQYLSDFNIWELGTFKIFCAVLCVSLVCSVIYLIFLRLWFSVALGSALMLLFSLANYFVTQFRGNELTPFDFLAITTAKNVAGQYSIVMPTTFLFCSILWGMFIIWGLLYLFRSKKKRRVSGFNWKSRCYALVLVIIMIIVWFISCSKAEVYCWANDGTRYNGFYLNFSSQLINALRDKRPNGYDIEKIQDLEEEYTDTEAEKEESPDIIVIMNESFADLDVLGSDLFTENNVTPFYDSLVDDTVKGYALSSVYGGTTANSEFEFLTGGTMGFLESYDSPYQFYINRRYYSIAQYLKSLDYYCMATHPYYASGWSRTEVYPLLGFDKMTFSDDYPNEYYIRDYISDWEMYEYIIEEYETLKEESKKVFLFGVSMQNHGGYGYPSGEKCPVLELEGYQYSTPEAEQYLGLIRESDIALEYLIDYFDKCENDVVVLFFGDHFPNLSEAFYEELHNGQLDTLDERMLKYKVPFFVWANYDIEEAEIECSSLNFLSNYLLEAAGLPLPAYNAFLKDVNETIPGMNAYGYYSKEKDSFVEYSEASGKEAEMLNKYNMLQYNCMFDKNGRSEVFFPLVDEE